MVSRFHTTPQNEGPIGQGGTIQLAMQIVHLVLPALLDNFNPTCASHSSAIHLA